jgi:hypothetical protein
MPIARSALSFSIRAARNRFSSSRASVMARL